jgi:glycosyltransferase involved in cell wall biosynthesis
MKILFVIRGLSNSGGMERVSTILINELAERGYEMGVVAYQRSNIFFELHPSVKAHFLYNKTKDKRGGVTRDISRRIELKKLYKLEKPDLIILVGSRYGLINIPHSGDIPKITWEHFNVAHKSSWLHSLARRLAAKTSTIVTLTKQDAVNYQKKYGAKHTLCIPNPISVDNREKSPLTQKNVLAIGRLARQKGFDMLLNVWKKTKNSKKGWKLKIVGMGKEKQINEYITLIDKYNIGSSVELLPPTKNIAAIYQNASVFVLSSRWEGLPLVLIEAQAMGLPSVSFDCETGPNEIIIDNQTGFLISCFDEEKMAEKLDLLMENEDMRQAFSKAAIEQSKKFSPSAFFDKWEKLIAKFNKKI